MKHFLLFLFFFIATISRLKAQSVFAGFDRKVCTFSNGQHILGNDLNPSNTQWSPSTGLSCTTCKQPNFSPSGFADGFYTYTATATIGGVMYTDDVTIQVSTEPDDFSIAATISGTISNCGDSLQITTYTLTNNPGFSFVAQWSPSIGLSSDNVLSPYAYDYPSGTRVYTIVVTYSSFGCSESSNATVIANTAGCPAPLPVELVSFTAESKNCKSILTWKTGTEINFDHFEIQSSVDNMNFTNMGEIKAKGNNATYSFTDYTRKKQVYYRLAMTDIDGSTKYSNVIVLNSTCEREGIYIYPNPTNDIVNVSFEYSSFIGKRINITSVDGKVIKDFAITQLNEVIDLSGYNAGIYMINIPGYNNFKVIKN